MDLGFWEGLEGIKAKLQNLNLAMKEQPPGYNRMEPNPFQSDQQHQALHNLGPARNDSSPVKGTLAGQRFQQSNQIEAQNPGIFSGPGNWRVPNGSPIPGMTMDRMPQLSNQKSERPTKTWY